MSDLVSDPVFNDVGPPLTRLQNMARIAKGLALIFFFLPWVTISCAGTKLASISGMNLATGNIGMKNPMSGQMEAMKEGGGVNPYALAALIIIVALLVLSFVWKNRAALMVGLVGSLVAAGSLLFGIAYKTVGEARAKMNAELGDMGGPPAGMDAQSAEMGRQMAQSLSMNLEFGFWLTVISLIAAAVFYWMMSTGKSNLSSGTATPPTDNGA